MWSKNLIKFISIVIFLFGFNQVHAAAEPLIIPGATIESSGGDTLVAPAIGVWSYTGKITFQGPESNYRLLLSDISTSIGGFEYLGGTISTATNKLVEFDYNVRGSDIQEIGFEIEEGEYWLTLFAITGSTSNIGTLGLDFQLQSEVPLPASAWMMLSALGALGLMKRKSITKKLNK